MDGATFNMRSALSLLPGRFTTGRTARRRCRGTARLAANSCWSESACWQICCKPLTLQIVYSDHMEPAGSVMFQHPCKHQLEGVGFVPEGKSRFVATSAPQSNEFAIALHLAKKGGEVCRQGGSRGSQRRRG
jgi:hypothetical protein